MAQREIIDTVKKYANFLKENHFPIRQVYLFGSHARGNERKESDIDLAIVLPNVQDSLLMQYQMMRLRRDFDLRIEPHPFDELDFNPSNPFANEILSTGIRVL